MTIERTLLPGVGISHAVTTSTQQRLGVISHLSGRRDLVVYDPADPERAAWTVILDDHEAHQLADLLAGTVTADHLSQLEHLVDGVSAVRIRIPAGSAYDGVPLSATRARSRTGATVVAVARANGEVIAAPQPEFVLHHDDVVVAVGDEHGIAALTALFAGSPLA